CQGQPCRRAECAFACSAPRRAPRWSPWRWWRRLARPRRLPRRRRAQPQPAPEPIVRRWRRRGVSCARMAGCRCEEGVAGAAAPSPPPAPRLAATCRSAIGTPACRPRRGGKPLAPKARPRRAPSSGPTPCVACRG
ncbi:MAG: hypothetical protein AVDCRST_MAG04-3706, partial [uncultured Acetobacteraceae bacterium]